MRALDPSRNRGVVQSAQAFIAHVAVLRPSSVETRTGDRHEDTSDTPTAAPSARPRTRVDEHRTPAMCAVLDRLSHVLHRRR
jgi:hypothetical protein